MSLADHKGIKEDVWALKQVFNVFVVKLYGFCLRWRDSPGGRGLQNIKFLLQNLSHAVQQNHEAGRVMNVYTEKKPVEIAHFVSTVSTRVSPQTINQKSTVRSLLAT